MARMVRFLLPWVLVATGLGGNAWSQDQKVSREREALRRSQQQVQQLRQEKTALEEKLALADRAKADMAQEREKLANQVGGARASARQEGAKREQLQQSLGLLSAELQAAKGDRVALQAQKAELEQRLAALQARQTATEGDLARALAARQQVDTALQARVRQVNTCEDKNARLYRHGRDLIAQCSDRSGTDAVLRLEPFTGIHRVALENLLEEYRDKLDAQKLRPGE